MAELSKIEKANNRLEPKSPAEHVRLDKLLRDIPIQSGVDLRCPSFGEVIVVIPSEHKAKAKTHFWEGLAYVRNDFSPLNRENFEGAYDAAFYHINGFMRGFLSDEPVAKMKVAGRELKREEVAQCFIDLAANGKFSANVRIFINGLIQKPSNNPLTSKKS